MKPWGNDDMLFCELWSFATGKIEESIWPLMSRVKPFFGASSDDHSVNGQPVYELLLPDLRIDGGVIMRHVERDLYGLRVIADE